MKYALLFFISLSSFAQTYQVESRGHKFVYETSSKGASLRSKTLNFTLDQKPCAKNLIEDIQNYFKKQLKFRTKGKENVVTVNDGKTTIHVPMGHLNGKRLMLFPDYFAEKSLVYKELCK